MPSIRARACGLRRKAACSAPGNGMSSTKAPSPRSSFGSTLRSMRAPNIRVDMRAPYLCSPEQFGGATHRGDDVEISGAAAEVAGQQVPDAIVGEIKRLRLLEAPDDVHHHSGRAVTALQAVTFLERLLHRMQRAVSGGDGFDGADMIAVGLHRQR